MTFKISETSTIRIASSKVIRSKAKIKSEVENSKAAFK